MFAPLRHSHIDLRLGGVEPILLSPAHHRLHYSIEPQHRIKNFAARMQALGEFPITMRVALMTNFIAPYRLPVLKALRDRVGDLRVLVSTRMERDRSWAVEWGSLDVMVQRTLTMWLRARDICGLSRQMEIYVPYDTLRELKCWALRSEPTSRRKPRSELAE